MIRGYFRLGSGWPVPWVRVLVFISSMSSAWAPVEFLLDTGCAATALNPLDSVRRVGIPGTRLTTAGEWSRVSQTFGVGGASLNFPVAARFAFREEQDGWMILDEELQIAQLTPASRALPSLLGWNLLRYFEISVNQQSQLVTLRRL